MNQTDSATEKITALLESLRSLAGFDFAFAVDEQPLPPAAAAPAGDDASGHATMALSVRLSGPDTPLLLDRNGELLHALESLAADILRLAPNQAEEISFDADGFKARREQAIALAAQQAITQVRATGQPFAFAPMNARERRLLHLALVPSGLATASSGFGPRRFVVLYPEGQVPRPESFASTPPSRPFRPVRTAGLRNADRSGRGPRPDSAPRQNRSPSPPAAPRLDPNGNPIETLPGPGESPVEAANTDDRLASLRRAFRKR